MIKTVYIIMLIAYSAITYAQNAENMFKTRISVPPYTIGDYQIDPLKKTIGVFEMTGGYVWGEDGRGYHWDGFHYVLSNKYNYNKTTLHIIGTNVFFREDYTDFSDIDASRLPKFKLDTSILQQQKPIIDYSNTLTPPPDFSKYRPAPAPLKEEYQIDELTLIYSDPNGDKTICRNNKSLLLFRRERTAVIPNRIDISKYNVINNFLYQDTLGDLYVLPPYLSHEFKLDKVEGITGLHLQSICHVAGNYFTDKNGLYFLGHNEKDTIRKVWYDTKRSTQSVKLEDSKGEIIKPIIYRNYFIYGQSVYAISPRPEIAKLNLDINKMKEHLLNDYKQAYVISDGHNTYYTSQLGAYTTSDQFMKREIKEKLKSNFFWKDVDKWKVTYLEVVKAKNNSYYVVSDDAPDHKDGILHFTFIYSPTGVYAYNVNNDRSLHKVSKVYIRNSDTKKYEELDISKFKRINDDLYVYKNKLYSHNSYPVKEPIDFNNIRFIKLGEENTNFITDGKCLLYTGATGGYSSIDDNGDYKVIYQGLIRYDIDIPKLIAITKNMLFDGKLLITRNSSNIVAIPVCELGFDVKIVTH